MIENYEIKSFNGEEVLYLYLNYSYEFGDFFNRCNVSYMKDRVKQYLATMKVKFAGGKVLFIVGGIGLATLFLTPTDISEVYALQDASTSNSIIEKVIDENSLFNDVLVSVEEEIQKEENIEHSESNHVMSTKDRIDDVYK